MIDYDNKLKPFPKKQITNYNSFINPFEKNDSSLANKTFEEVKDLFKKNYQIDLTDASDEPDTETSYRGKAWKHYAPDPATLSDPSVTADWQRQIAPLTDPSKILSNGYEKPMSVALYNSDSNNKTYLYNGVSFSFIEEKRYYSPKQKSDLKNGMIVEYFNNSKWNTKQILNVDKEYEELYRLLIKYNKLRIESN